MRAAILTSFVVAASLVSPASAGRPGQPDLPCGFTAFPDPRPESSYDAYVAVVEGGPILQSGTLTCTIKVGAGTHAAPYVHGSSVSATGTGVTVLPPAVRSYVQSAYEVYLCDEFTDAAGVTWLWDDDTALWTNDPAGACRLAVARSATDDPVFPPLDDLPEVLGEFLDTVADPIGCPVLGALAPGAPPLLDVRPDGDTYLAGDLVVDCPPEERGEGVGFDRLATRAVGSLPPRTAGAIRVGDTGDGPRWEVSGTLVSVDWDCAADGADVVCDWDGYLARPACREVSAVAGVLAADGRARARVACVRGTVVESATTAVAGETLPVAFAERGTTPQPVTSLRCTPDDGAGGPPRAPYVVACGFTF